MASILYCGSETRKVVDPRCRRLDHRWLLSLNWKIACRRLCLSRKEEKSRFESSTFLITKQVKLRSQYTIRESCLHAVHTAAGNKMSDFFGRRLPLTSLRTELARFRSIALGARCPFPPTKESGRQIIGLHGLAHYTSSPQSIQSRLSDENPSLQMRVLAESKNGKHLMTCCLESAKVISWIGTRAPNMSYRRPVGTERRDGPTSHRRSCHTVASNNRS